MTDSRSSAWAGWVIFAGTMMLVIGSINVIQGVVALVWDEHLVLIPDRLMLVDTTAWGWSLVLSGLLMYVVGIGLFAAQTWARVLAIIVIGVHAVAQIAWLDAFPFWSVLMIVLDTIVLFALTARWADARSELSYAEESYRG